MKETMADNHYTTSNHCCVLLLGLTATVLSKTAVCRTQVTTH